jgi:hypothetical protein
MQVIINMQVTACHMCNFVNLASSHHVLELYGIRIMSHVGNLHDRTPGTPLPCLYYLKSIVQVSGVPGFCRASLHTLYNSDAMYYIC